MLFCCCRGTKENTSQHFHLQTDTHRENFEWNPRWVGRRRLHWCADLCNFVKFPLCCSFWWFFADPSMRELVKRILPLCSNFSVVTRFIEGDTTQTNGQHLRGFPIPQRVVSALVLWLFVAKNSFGTGEDFISKLIWSCFAALQTSLHLSTDWWITHWARQWESW